MTSKPPSLHDLLKKLQSDANQAGQHHAIPDQVVDSLLTKERLKEDDVSVNAAEDLRRMRQQVFWFAITLPAVLLAALPAQIWFYLWLLTPSKTAGAGMADATKALDGANADAAAALVDAAALLAQANAVEGLGMPATALIFGTYLGITTIYSALLYGLFRSLSGSRKRGTIADIHPVTRTFFGGGE